VQKTASDSSFLGVSVVLWRESIFW